MRKIIPKFLRNLDKRMMYRSPQLWITKIHYAIPAALFLAAILFAITSAIGYNPSDELPEQQTSFMFLLLPAIAIFFYWFVIQAQYNVDKNYGRLSIGHDYQNFFSYLIIIGTFFLVMISIPTGQLFSVDNAVSDQELRNDIRTLNTGYAYFTGDFEVKSYKSDQPGEYQPAVLKVTPKRYIDYYDMYDNYGWENEVERAFDDANTEGEDVYTREVRYEQAIEEINALAAVYNKYTYKDIHPIAKHVLANPGEYYDNQYDYDYEYGYGNKNYLRWTVEDRVEDIYRVKFKDHYMSIFNYEFMLVMFAIIGYLALLTWIFKNVNWKNYITAGISVLVTPLIGGITALFMYEVMDINHGVEEEMIFGLLVVLNALFLLFVIVPLLRKKYSSLGVVCMILLQFWMPILIGVYGHLIMEMDRSYYYDNDYGYSWEYRHEMRQWMGYVLYYGSWIFMIATIPLFKKYYAYMWAFPKKK
jgi:hypothetical protein